MKPNHCIPTILAMTLLAATAPPAPATTLDLEPNESVLRSTFRSAGEPRSYLRLVAGRPATFNVCGQGELAVLSRALLESKAGAARYTLKLSIDGARPPHELTYRAARADTGRFDGRVPATALRRTSLSLGRGCHSLSLSLERSTAETVGVRLSFRERAPSRRAWQDAATLGGRPATLVVGDRRTPYRRLGGEESLTLDVEGPAWVRLLCRPILGQPGGDFRVDVRRRQKLYRSYSLSSQKSRRGRLAADPSLPIGRASEVVFAVGGGSHRLEVLPTSRAGLLLRAQLAEAPAAGRNPGTVETRWQARARLASYYDDNILRYSEKFIQRFEEGRDAARFRVSSLDDTIYRADVYLDRIVPGFGRRESSIGFDVEHRLYQRNSIKDWTRLRLSFGHELPRGRRIGLDLSYLPDFYVRHLRDSDLTGRRDGTDPFQAFAFEKSEARWTLAQDIGASSRLRYHLAGARFVHTEAFREFDSDNLAAGARLDHHLTPRWRLSAGLEATDSDARGYDQPGETRATSDDTDPSYRQLDLMAAARVRLPTRRRQTLFFQVETGRRDYTTGKSEALAPLHAGREDDLWRFYASWQLALAGRRHLTVFLQARDRSSTAPVEIDIGTEKDYEQVEAGVRLSMSFTD